MVKLTPELINQSMQYMNPCRDRELDLRGKSLFCVLVSIFKVMLFRLYSTYYNKWTNFLIFNTEIEQYFNFKIKYKFFRI